MTRKPSHSVLIRTIREMLVLAQGERCAYCGDKMLSVGYSQSSATLEHIVPLSIGGTWDIPNLVAVHRRCNLERNSAIVKLLSDPHNAPELKVVPHFGDSGQ